MFFVCHRPNDTKVARDYSNSAIKAKWLILFASFIKKNRRISIM
jgi:hypothetical protein